MDFGHTLSARLLQGVQGLLTSRNDVLYRNDRPSLVVQDPLRSHQRQRANFWPETQTVPPLLELYSGRNYDRAILGLGVSRPRPSMLAASYRLTRTGLQQCSH